MSEIMPDKRFTEVIDGQQVVRTVSVSGDIVPEPAKDPAKYFTALLQTDSGLQQVVKTYVMGGGGAGDVVLVVPTLPETGEEGKIYLVPTGLTRDNYPIYQEFCWYNEEWVALGAFDMSIDPHGIVYEESFNATTGVWVVRATPSN